MNKHKLLDSINVGVRRFIDLVVGFRYISMAYSQEGEDLILLSTLFGLNKPGFYVDVGAHHPQRFSNTYLLYQKGWRGINIDANPKSIELFEKYRPNDINVLSGIGKKAGKFTFYFFDEPAVNTFDGKIAQYLVKNTAYKLVQKRKIKTVPLYMVLDKYVQTNTKVDILTIDVEGKDLEVLKSNNWSKYKPLYILVERRGDERQKGGLSFKQCLKDEAAVFLSYKGYEIFAKTANTIFFRLKKSQTK